MALYVKSLAGRSFFRTDWFFLNKSVAGWNDLLHKLSMVYKSQKHACNALHSLVERTGMLLPLRLHAAHITVRRFMPLGKYKTWWPVLTMQAWAQYLLQRYPKVLLGGYDIENVLGWKSLFYQFWMAYRSVDSSHPIYTSDFSWETTIPYCFHGDEGRGRGRVPFLVASWQPLVSHKGIEYCNDSSCLVDVKALTGKLPSFFDNLLHLALGVCPSTAFSILPFVLPMHTT